MTHPHRDLIIALLDDPTLEVEWFDDYDAEWHPCVEPLANMVNYTSVKHRLREKPKPDVVIDYAIELSDYVVNDPQGARLNFWTTRKSNCRFTFTADGVLKNAEVI